MPIRNDHTQYLAARFPKLIQADVTICIDAGNISSMAKAFSVLNAASQCIEDPPNFTGRKAQNDLKVRVSVPLHAMGMRIAGIGKETGFFFPARIAGAVCYKMDDAEVFHTICKLPKRMCLDYLIDFDEDENEDTEFHCVVGSSEDGELTAALFTIMKSGVYYWYWGKDCNGEVCCLFADFFTYQ